MADTAHAKTDEKLEEMEKRMSAIYSRAEKEIQKTKNIPNGARERSCMVSGSPK